MLEFKVMLGGKDITNHLMIYLGIVLFPQFVHGLIILVTNIVESGLWIAGLFH